MEKQEQDGGQMRELAWMVSLPPGMLRAVRDEGLHPASGEIVYGADPVGCPLGSGGGTAHMLAEAAASMGCSIPALLSQYGSVVLHGGGQSRRVPAYAAAGKPFMPMPVFRWSAGQRLDQTLFDMQRGFITECLQQASHDTALAIASGDVLLQADAALPALPDADVVMLGMHARPEDACHFGVMFCERDDASCLRFFLQKPHPDTIRKHSQDTQYFVDCGLWLLRERAVYALLAQCGWQAEQGDFAGGAVQPYDLYSAWGPRFGTQPVVQDDTLAGLQVAVAVVNNGRFFHFGRSRDILDSVYELQNPPVDATRGQQPLRAPHPRQFVQNAVCVPELGRDAQQCLWVENAVVGKHWQLQERHMITNVPQNDWHLSLPAGSCLDMPPVVGGGRVIRVYGMEDAFRGSVSDPATCLQGDAVTAWLAARGLSLADVGCEPDTDIQDAGLFPVLPEDEIDDTFLQWFLCGGDDARQVARWRDVERLSARDLLERVDVRRVYAERRSRLLAVLPEMAARYRHNMFLQLDLAHTGRLLAEAGYGPEVVPVPEPQQSPLMRMHAHLLASRLAGAAEAVPGQADCEEQAAFHVLRDAILAPVLAEPVLPRCQVLEDQIVWGRSPARLDLAGGWTDTPPYCIEHGGAVLNMAVTLNGQPPVQVFGRVTREPCLLIRSIDLGQSARLETYADVEQYAQLGSGFAIARAAFALAGFLPTFCETSYPSLQAQLAAFGGGIEVNMLAAIPKGSGLGTSSILAATLLGVLADLTGLGWDRAAIGRRVLALEQMLTSGGGWQDQMGALYGGVKLIETRPGILQVPQVRWAPNAFFAGTEMQGRMLLYYTGITRVAHHILADIVRGLFLNERTRLDVMRQIGLHATSLYEQILQQDVEGFVRGVQRSWILNQQLDAGTNVPGVQEIVARCGSALAACKLAGAGGGGYLMLLAHDAHAADWIRQELVRNPPNGRARFVEWALAADGLQITRS